MKKWIAAAVGLVILAMGMIAAYPLLEPARLLYAIHGIDVSHHQQTIRWPSVRSDGARFAYIKAPEGGDFVDPRFAQNWTGALAAGLRVGAYHFFTHALFSPDGSRFGARRRGGSSSTRCGCRGPALGFWRPPRPRR